MYNVSIPPIKITIGSNTIELKNDSDAYAYLNAVANNSPSTDRWRKGYQFDEKVPASEWNWTFGQMTRLMFRMRYDLYSSTQELMHFIKDKIPDATFDDTDDIDMTQENANHQLLDAVDISIFTDRKIIAGTQTDNPAQYKSPLGSVTTSSLSGKVAVDPNTGVMTVNGMGDVAGVGNIVNPNALTNLTAILANIMNVIYPVGCYYWSSVSTDPSLLFGGTWVRVSGVMLYAAEDNVSGYTAGSTGGAKEVTLTTAQIPSHAHGPGTYRITGKWSASESGAFHYKDASGSGAVYLTGEKWYKGADDSADNSPVFGLDAHGPDIPAEHTPSNWSGVTSYVGGSGAHNNMPPYLAAYCWRRTA